MGNFFYYPLEAEATSYHRRQDYNSLGVRKATIIREDNEIDKLHRNYCSEIFMTRKTSSEKRLLLTLEDETYAQRYPQWNVDDISNFKVQFQLFDMNADGLIDFRELAFVLDHVGENSRPDERSICFDEIDLDGTGTIDFEEFLVILSWLQREESTTKTGGNIGYIITRGASQVNQIRKMSVFKQLVNGIF